jgi:DNA-directed RNA polymerase subunit L
MCLSLYMWYMGVMVYMDCTLINLMHLVHPEQHPVHADQFDVSHELLHVPLMTVLTENKLKTNEQEEEQQVKK